MNKLYSIMLRRYLAYEVYVIICVLFILICCKKPYVCHYYMLKVFTFNGLVGFIVGNLWVLSFIINTSIYNTKNTLKTLKSQGFLKI